MSSFEVSFKDQSECIDGIRAKLCGEVDCFDENYSLVSNQQAIMQLSNTRK
jgi:hypothetical protein